MDSVSDQRWMRQALALARRGQEQGEVPVGAILILNDEVIGQAYNSPITHCDPGAHAEILALREAGKRLGNYRLLGATLYVTLEPCVMCAMAMVHARIERLVFGALDPKTGGVSSRINLFAEPYVNHRVQWEGGILAEECGLLLREFFERRRK